MVGYMSRWFMFTLALFFMKLVAGERVDIQQKKKALLTKIRKNNAKKIANAADRKFLNEICGKVLQIPPSPSKRQAIEKAKKRLTGAPAVRPIENAFFKRDSSDTATVERCMHAVLLHTFVHDNNLSKIAIPSKQLHFDEYGRPHAVARKVEGRLLDEDDSMRLLTGEHIEQLSTLR